MRLFGGNLCESGAEEREMFESQASESSWKPNNKEKLEAASQRPKRCLFTVQSFGPKNTISEQSFVAKINFSV